MNQELEQLFKPPEQNLLYGKPIPEDLKSWFIEVYNYLEGDIPHCGFNDILLREVGLDYASNVRG